MAFGHSTKATQARRSRGTERMMTFAPVACGSAPIHADEPSSAVANGMPGMPGIGEIVSTRR